MKTKWTIAKQNPNGKLALVGNGQAWVYKMKAVEHWNTLRYGCRGIYQIIEVPASITNDRCAMLAFINEDVETRKKILAD